MPGLSRSCCEGACRYTAVRDMVCAMVARVPDVVQLVGLVAVLVGAALEFGGGGLLVGGAVVVVVGWAMRAVQMSGSGR